MSTAAAGQAYHNNLVGPVMRAGDLAMAVIEAAKVDNPGKDIYVDDKRAYIRIHAEQEMIPRQVRLGLRSIRAVNTFLHRPEPDLARLAYASGALWHTGIMAASVETWWNLGRRVLPEMMRLFERLGEVINTPREPQALRDIYARMPVRSFSRDLLAAVPGVAAVMEMQGVWWSDWNHPERIMKTLTRLGRDTASVMPHLRAAVAERQSAQTLDIAMAHRADGWSGER